MDAFGPSPLPLPTRTRTRTTANIVNIRVQRAVLRSHQKPPNRVTLVTLSGVHIRTDFAYVPPPMGCRLRLWPSLFMLARPPDELRVKNLNDSRRGAALGGVSDRPTDEKHMPLYEHVFLARQDLAQAQVDALAENATKILTDNGGKVVKTETWGLKSLAYKIAKNRKAHFVMLDVDAPAPAIAELERQTNINEDVIRFMTIRVDELEKEPSAMMKRERSGRDDRGGRSDRGDRGERSDRGDRGDRGDRPVRAREEEAQ